MKSIDILLTVMWVICYYLKSLYYCMVFNNFSSNYLYRFITLCFRVGESKLDFWVEFLWIILVHMLTCTSICELEVRKNEARYVGNCVGYKQ